IVDMIPPGFTFRIRLFSWSAMYMFPDPSVHTATGLLSCAADAAPPSPEKPVVDIPANVLMIPEVLTIRTRRPSAHIYILPAASTATADGEPRPAVTAAVPSPP